MATKRQLSYRYNRLSDNERLLHFLLKFSCLKGLIKRGDNKILPVRFTDDDMLWVSKSYKIPIDDLNSAMSNLIKKEFLVKTELDSVYEIN